MRLSDLQTGDKAVVVKVLGYGAFRKRIIEMGFVRGQTVLVELNAPLKDPIKYKIMDYEISLRRSEASLVEVITPEEANQLENRQGEKNKLNVESWKTEEDDCIERALTQSSKTINIALVGNPNCGKHLYSTLPPVHMSMWAIIAALRSMPKRDFSNIKVITSTYAIYRVHTLFRPILRKSYMFAVI